MHYISSNIFLLLLIFFKFNDSIIVAQISIGKKDTTVIKKLNISIKDNNYAPFVKEGFMYFTSDKPLKIGKLTWNDDYGNPTNIFRAKLKDSINLTEVISINKVNTELNEGSICFSKTGAYYSSNRKVLNKLNSKQIPSRIYYLNSIEDSSNTKPVELNLQLNDSISVSHPAIYKDSILFFTLLRKSDINGSDIYMSVLTDSVWSSPKKCQTPINSNFNEGFPTIYNDQLYFSSDRDGGLDGLDIYSVDLRLDSMMLNKFPELNSQKDDFSVYFSSDNSGYLSSNRMKNDDIFYFHKVSKPNFNIAVEQTINTYCYVFKEQTTYENKDTLNMDYEWSFGDGYKSKGISTNHCFEGEGNYHIELNVLEKNSGEIFENALSYELEIKNERQLYISSYDTVQVGDTVKLNSDYSNIEGYTIEKYYWDFNDGKFYEGNHINYIFLKPGEVIVKLISEGQLESKKKTFGVYKKIVVLNKYTLSPTTKLVIPLINSKSTSKLYK